MRLNATSLRVTNLLLYDKSKYNSRDTKAYLPEYPYGISEATAFRLLNPRSRRAAAGNNTKSNFSTYLHRASRISNGEVEKKRIKTLLLCYTAVPYEDRYIIIPVYLIARSQCHLYLFDFSIRNRPYRHGRFARVT